MLTEIQHGTQQAKIKLTVSTALHDAEWDQFILETPDGHYTQTALWSEIKKTQGWSPLRLIFKDDQGIVGGAQILTRKLPLFGFMGYVSKGPVCHDQNPELYQLVLKEIIKVCKQHRIVYLSIQPSDQGEHVVPMLIEMGMSKSTQGDLEKPATILIDLRPDENGILAQIKAKRRRYVRFSQKQGFSIRHGKREDLDIFSRLHMATGERSHFETQSKIFFEKLWDVFEPLGYIDLLVEEYDGKAVTAYLIIKYKKTGNAFRIGWTGEYGNKYPNEGAIWNGFLWAKSDGCEIFDLGGIDTEAAKALLNGNPVPASIQGTYSEYKLHFSENVVLYPETYEKFLNPVLFRIYRIMQLNPIINQFARKIYKMSRKR